MTNTAVKGLTTNPWFGCHTAIATPFLDDRVDFESLGRLVAHQLEGKVTGIVPCGTTGESPTLSDAEKEEVVKFVVKEAGGRVAVLVGTGSNNTAKVVFHTKKARDAGATGALVVTPYYNKPTQEGLYRHFEAVAKAVPGFPIVLYEIPGRTCVSLDVETIARIVKACPNVAAVKEASGKPERVTKIRALVPSCAVLSGDDALTLPVMSLGGTGVVSVVSNVIPGEISALTAAAARGDFREANRINDRVDPLTRAMFLETNPSPVKYALAKAGIFASPEVRLPLVEPSASTRKEIEAALEQVVPAAKARR
jgi:4-hydroxy-tetrahydrodipicolinate synthase